MRRAFIVTAYLLASAAAIIVSVYEGISIFNSKNSPKMRENLNAVIDLQSIKRTNSLDVGLNYELLKEYAAAREDTIRISLAQDGASYPDSLREGTVDILVIPYSETVPMDGISFSRPVENTSMWAVRSDYRKDLAEIDSWLNAHLASDDYSARKELFLTRFNPMKRAKQSIPSTELSPYDELIKHYAGRIGWDWRLLAALIYSESKFHIEAGSHRNATGLMQLKTRTAERFGTSDLLDPEENIKAGTAFIHRLQDSFRQDASSPDDLNKFVLAAYNAGESRIRDCIGFAAFKEVNTGKWEDVVSVIPQMRDSTALETGILKHGTFKGEETIKYVNHVLAIYDSFKAICKEQAPY